MIARAGLSITGALLVGSLLLPGRLLSLGQQPVVAFTVWSTVAFVCYALALWVSAARDSETTGPRGMSRWLVPVVVAILLRFGMLAYPALLSDDVYRYVWDARVLAHGISPYAYSPNAPELGFLRDDLWLGINAKDEVTPYPPLAQYWFFVVRLVGGESIFAQRLGAVLGDLVVLGLLGLVCRRVDGLRAWLVYAWSPLPVLQFAHSAHNDWLALVGIVLAWLAAGHRGWLAAVGVAWATAAKVVPAVIAPVALGYVSGWPWLVGAALVAAAVAPFVVGGHPVGLQQTGAASVFNDSVHLVLERAIGLTGLPAAGTIATLLGLGVAGAIALWCGWRVTRGRLDVASGMLVSLLAVLLVVPTVEPWYLTWLLPPLGAVVWRWSGPGRVVAVGVLLWTGTVQLTELTYLTPGAWPVVRLVEYGPMFLALAWWGGVTLRSAGRTATASQA